MLFGVSVDELLGKEAPPVIVTLQDAMDTVVAVELTPREQAMLVAFRSLTDEQKEQLMKFSGDLVNEDAEN